MVRRGPLGQSAVRTDCECEVRWFIGYIRSMDLVNLDLDRLFVLDRHRLRLEHKHTLALARRHPASGGPAGRCPPGSTLRTTQRCSSGSRAPRLPGLRRAAGRRRITRPLPRLFFFPPTDARCADRHSAAQQDSNNKSRRGGSTPLRGMPTVSGSSRGPKDRGADSAAQNAELQRLTKAPVKHDRARPSCTAQRLFPAHTAPDLSPRVSLPLLFPSLPSVRSVSKLMTFEFSTSHECKACQQQPGLLIPKQNTAWVPTSPCETMTFGGT